MFSQQKNELTGTPVLLKSNPKNVDFDNLPSMATVQHARSFSLDFVPQGETQVGVSPNGESVFDPKTSWFFNLHLPAANIWSKAQVLRNGWRKLLVEFSPDRSGFGPRKTKSFPFQDEWDLSKRPDYLNQVKPALARLGSDLFSALFEDDNELATRGETLLTKTKRHRFVERIRETMREPGKVITLHGDAIHVPWQMIYTHPGNDELTSDGSNCIDAGFWGLSHIIEQCPFDPSSSSGILHRAKGASLFGSQHIDMKIGLLNQPLLAKAHSKYLENLQDNAKSIFRLRERKSDFEMAVRSVNFNDQLMYFFCHGSCEVSLSNVSDGSPWIKLTDGESIIPTEIASWLQTHNGVFPTNPFVFMNTCQSGQLTNQFFPSLAHTFLQRGASGVIAPQIDMPILFAEEFAKRFFGDFLDESQQSAGLLVHSLANEFWNRYKNPLGLTYGLFRAIDVVVAQDNEKDGETQAR